MFSNQNTDFPLELDAFAGLKRNLERLAEISTQYDTREESMISI